MPSSVSDEMGFHPCHLWVRRCSETGEAHVGLSDFAQKQLGKIMYVDLPQAGTSIEADIPFGTVESFKVVSELMAPVSGVVLDVNGSLKGQANLLNDDCYGAGWLVRIRVDENADLSPLLTADAYMQMLGAKAR